MTSEQRNILGFIMLGSGLALTLVAAITAWGATQRWFAVVETHEAYGQLRHGRLADARKLAATAAERASDEPTPALLATDPADTAALDRLVWVAARCKRHDDRQAVFAAIGLMRVAAGKPADVDLTGTADGRLLEMIAAVNAGRDPGKFKLADGEAPPHANLLRAAHTVLLRHAWAAGKVNEARAHAGALLLMAPRSADAPAMLFLVAASSPVVPDEVALRHAEAIRVDQREAVIRAVAALVPLRREAIAATWPKAVEGLP